PVSRNRKPHRPKIDRFPQPIDLPAESSQNRQTILGNRPIHRPRSTDYLPIFSGYLPTRSLQPLASVAAHFSFSAFCPVVRSLWSSMAAAFVKAGTWLERLF